jgi:hypothetical protein
VLGVGAPVAKGAWLLELYADHRTVGLRALAPALRALAPALRALAPALRALVAVAATTGPAHLR